jgi:hypothetical protein
MLRGGVRRGEVGVTSCTVHSIAIKDDAELCAPATLSVPPPAQGSSSDGGSDGDEKGEAQGEAGLYQVSQ